MTSYGKVANLSVPSAGSQLWKFFQHVLIERYKFECHVLETCLAMTRKWVAAKSLVLRHTDTSYYIATVILQCVTVLIAYYHNPYTLKYSVPSTHHRFIMKFNHSAVSALEKALSLLLSISASLAARSIALVPVFFHQSKTHASKAKIQTVLASYLPRTHAMMMNISKDISNLCC